MLSFRKSLFCLFCQLLILASSALAGNVLKNGTFATSSSGWTFLALPSAEGVSHADYDAGEGNPAGSVKCWLDNNGTPNNSHRFYQIVPVNIGQKYKLTGDWKGNLVGNNANNPSSRNWIEVFVGFWDAPNGTDWGPITYKKGFTGGPNTDTGIWDWESFLSSPAGTGPLYPGDGVFTATRAYMVVSVNLGGTINSVSPSNPAWVYIDNFKILPCHEESCMDASADFKYLAWVTSNWLDCNIDPATSCW